MIHHAPENQCKSAIGVVWLKCEKCFEEWNIQDLGDRMVAFCPFCGAEYQEKEPERFSSLVECFQYLKRRFTYTVFFEPKKVLAYVSDFMPELLVEKRILKIVLETGVYKQLFDDAGNIIELNIDKTKYTLVHNYGMSEQWAGEAVDWLVKAFVASPSKNLEEQKPLEKTDSLQTKQQTNTAPVNPAKKINGRDHKGVYTYIGQTDALGMPNGVGELTYSSGEKFIGTFVNGRLSGQGKWVTQSGEIFEGLFANGKQCECLGTLTDINGNVFKGYFRKGLRKHGEIHVTYSGNGETSVIWYNNGHKKY